MRVRTLLLLLLSVGLVVSCAKRKAAKQAEKDDQLIQEYLEANNLSAIKTESGLYYIVDTPGTGASCDENSDVRVAYTGYLRDGSVFDQSTPLGVEFNLQNVIRGWTEGIPYFREGGSGKLLIPSALGYGTQGSPSIPPNTVIIFEVELLEVL